MRYKVSGTITECSDFTKCGLQFVNKFSFADNGITEVGDFSREFEDEEVLSVTAYADDGAILVAPTLQFEVIG